MSRAILDHYVHSRKIRFKETWKQSECCRFHKVVLFQSPRAAYNADDYEIALAPRPGLKRVFF